MEALDLRTRPPRGPREQIAGLVFLPRAHLRERYTNLFDLLEADDALSFQGVAEG